MYIVETTIILHINLRKVNPDNTVLQYITANLWPKHFFRQCHHILLHFINFFKNSFQKNLLMATASSSAPLLQFTTLAYTCTTVTCNDYAYPDYSS
jgi:hypothetical protein